MEGKRKINIVREPGAFAPTKAHDIDAGYDLYAPRDLLIYAWETVDTGIHMEIPEGYVGFIKSKSGLNINRGLTSDAGVIDPGYTGSIVVKIVNSGNSPQKIARGDKIAQLVLLKTLDAELVEVDKLAETERGDKGFGSSGR